MLGSVCESCMNGKNDGIIRNVLQKLELRFGHTVQLQATRSKAKKVSIKSEAV